MSNLPFRFDAGSATHPGKIRDRNEDAFLVRTDAGLWAVADGMGGHEAGDVASQLVVASLNTIGIPASAIELLEEAEQRVFDANRQIVALGRQRGGVIGTTVAILLIRDDHFACVWAGDSRVYLAKPDGIKQISRDHTEVEELLASGTMTAEEIKNWPNNVITRAIGVKEPLELDVITGEFSAGDCFLICSDGLNKHVQDDEMLAIVVAEDAQPACDRLIALANERGGLDNVTTVIVRCHTANDATQPDAIGAVREPTLSPATLAINGSALTDVWN